MNWEERIQIETLWREDFTPKVIGEKIGRPEKTIWREIQRGWVTYQTSKYSSEERYNAQRGQIVYEKRMRSRTTRDRVDER